MDEDEVIYDGKLAHEASEVALDAHRAELAFRGVSMDETVQLAYMTGFMQGALWQATGDHDIDRVLGDS